MSLGMFIAFIILLIGFKKNPELQNNLQKNWLIQIAMLAFSHYRTGS